MSDSVPDIQRRVKDLERTVRQLVAEGTRDEYGSRPRGEDRKIRDELARAGRSVDVWPMDLFDDAGAAATALQAAWPVGSIFLSAVDTNPATLLGFGTWSAIGAGRVLVGQDVGDPDFDVLGDTGGAKTVAATGSNSAPTFTGDALGTHAHTVTSNVAVADHASHTHTVTPTGTIVWPAGVPTFAGDAVVAATDSGATHLFVEDLTGTGKSPVTTATGTISWPGGVPTFNGNNVVTAGPSATLSHGVTNNAVTSGATSAGTPSGTVSAPTFTGSASSVVQPFLVVKMWQRTA